MRHSDVVTFSLSLSLSLFFFFFFMWFMEYTVAFLFSLDDL